MYFYHKATHNYRRRRIFIDIIIRVQGVVYSIQHYVIKFVIDLRQTGRWFSPGAPVSSTNKTDQRSPRYNLNITESGVKHHKPNHWPNYRVQNRWYYRKNKIFLEFIINNFKMESKGILRDYYMTFSISALVLARDSHIKPDSIIFPYTLTYNLWDHCADTGSWNRGQISVFDLHLPRICPEITTTDF